MAAADLQVVSMGGEPVAVDLEGVTSVAQLRLAVASALGAAVGSVKLLSAGTLLEDSAGAMPDGLVTALLSSPGPSWYPARKYLHEGNEVLSVQWGINHNRGHEWHHCKVTFTDGQTMALQEEGQVTRGGEEDWEVATRVEKVTNFAKKLVKDLGFVTHMTEDYSDQPCFHEAYEAVPPEDPDEWEEWDDGYCRRGQRRKKKLGLQGTAQQADGMHGVAFRLGTWRDEPLVDIPIGELVNCLASDGEWLVVHHRDQVGYVKRRNVADVADSCTPLALFDKAVAQQADMHPAVGFYLGRLKGKPDAFIPNGTGLPVLGRTGDHAIVQWNDSVGFVKQRNLS